MPDTVFHNLVFGVRQVTVDDIPWLHELCAQAYPPGYYEASASERWVREFINSPTCLSLRGERAWMTIGMSNLPFAPSVKTAYYLPIASIGNAGRELLEMTRITVEWAIKNGAKKIFWAAMTGVDLGPLAKRTGAKPMSPSYVLDVYNV